MALNERQLRFVEAMLVEKTAEAAAITAGYDRKRARITASELLTRQDVQDAIAKLRAERAERTAITADSILKRLDAVANRCMQAEPVLDKDGNKTGEYRFEAAGANKALELIGKHLGMFRDKVDLTVQRSHEEALEELA